MIRSSQLSIYGLSLINAMIANRHYELIKNTTLNEKFGILLDKNPPRGTVSASIFPKVKYFVIGVGGNNIIDNDPNYKFSQHMAVDAALFQHIPFVLRTPERDLRDNEKVKYRLRKSININGTEYIAYYAKIVEHIDYRPYNLLVRNIEGNDIVSIMNMNSDRFLNPTPMVKPKDPDQVLRVDTVINRFKFEFSLSTEEQEELQSVFKILNLTNVTKITEIGICHGYEVIENSLPEIIGTQITYFIDVDLDVALDLDGKRAFHRNIELGGSEPYYN